MFPKKYLLYLVLVSSLFLGACQKEEVLVNEDYKTLGLSAHNLLSASEFTSLEIQISYMPGYAPDANSIEDLKIFLNSVLNKPGGIRISTRQVAASGKNILTISDIVRLEKQYRTLFSSSNTITVHVMISDADYNIPDILATSYWSTSICIFGKTVAESSGRPGQISRASLTTTLLQHEFGHLLGLVDQGSKMQVNHRDPAHGAHCENEACLMYYAIELGSGVMSSGIPALDENCRSDLRANGGK